MDAYRSQNDICRVAKQQKLAERRVAVWVSVRMSVRSSMVLLSLVAGPLAAQSNPTGGVAIQGQATFATTGNHLQVTTQNGAGLNHSAINWQNFSIPAGSSTYFQQPTAASTSINRVVTSTPSLIFGSLGSNGHLVLVNQSGITVGAGAVVDTAGFTASALRMTDADALSGRLRFGEAGASAGALSVNGNVLARSGDVVLLGSSVETGSQALVQAPNGSTVLAAGQQIEITGRGLEGIVLQVQAPTDSAVNLGTLSGDAVGIFAGTLKHSGTVQATQVSTQGGRVVLKAAGDAVVDGHARILATSVNGRGGQIDVLGQRVAVTDNALLDASGTSGGGSVRVGGDYQGKNAAVPNAQVTYLGAQARIKADAIANGDGGKVIVWADDTTRAYGSISARGGAQGGNGGFVETSGHRVLDVAGINVNASAPQGQNGQWLLDPTDITVVHAVAAAQVRGGPFDFAPPASSSIEDGTINAALASGTDVLLRTNGDAAPSPSAGGNGDIVFAPDVLIDPGASTATVAPTLSLQADRNIVLQGTFATAAGSIAGPLTVNLQPGLSMAGQVLSPGNLLLNAAGSGLVLAVQGGETWAQTGTLTLQGNAAINLADANNNWASFKNSGVVNIGSTTGAAFYSNFNGLNNGVMYNDGIFNVTASTAFEAEYNQTGALNIHGAGTVGTSLNLLNAKNISGIIDLAPVGASSASSLNLTGSQGSTAAFSNLTILSSEFNVTGPTLLYLGSFNAPLDATFTNVFAQHTNLSVGGVETNLSSATILAGDVAFNDVSLDPLNGQLALNNGRLGIAGGSFVVPAGVVYSGNVGIGAAGDLTIAYDIATSGSVELMAGWDNNPTNPALSAANPGSLIFGAGPLPNPVITAGGNLALSASGSGGIGASNAQLRVGGLTTAVSLAGPVTLDNAGNALSAMSAFVGSGDLNVLNHSTLNPAPLDLQGIAVAAGNVSVENFGALSSSGAIKAPNGSVTLTAHSPLTIANTVDAFGNITLAALSPDGTSNIALNGAMNSGAGSISVQTYNNFIQNSGLSAALGIDVSSVAGNLSFGPGAFSVGNPVSYSINGVAYQPPWLSSTLSGGATSFMLAFLDQFQAVLDMQPVTADDPLGLKKRGSEGILVEGEICTP